MRWLKNRVGEGFIFHVVISLHYYILFSQNVKEPSHFSMLESKLWHNKIETKRKCKGCKDGEIYQNLLPIPSQV